MPKSKDKKAKQSAFSVSYSEGKDNENKNIISKNYSNIVKMLKMSLPSFSIVLVGLVLLWNQIIRETDLFTIGFSSEVDFNAKKVVITNTKMIGNDKKHQPYNITAKLIAETKPGSHILKLTKPRAELKLNSGAWVNFDAPTGLFNQNTENLSFNDDVIIIHSAGYNIDTKEFSYNIKDAYAENHSPISASGAIGDIKAESFTYNGKEDVLTFHGKTIINYYPVKAKGNKK